MNIKTVSVTYGRKFNLGDYQSAEIAVTLWADIDEGDESALTATTILFEEAKSLVKAQALPLVKKERQVAAEVTQRFAGQKVVSSNGHKCAARDLFDIDDGLGAIYPVDGLPFGDK